MSFKIGGDAFGLVAHELFSDAGSAVAHRAGASQFATALQGGKFQRPDVEQGYQHAAHSDNLFSDHNDLLHSNNLSASYQLMQGLRKLAT